MPDHSSLAPASGGIVLATTDAGWRFFLRLINRGQAALLLSLMVLSSLTEGFGLLMLVPIAQAAAEGLLPPNSGLVGQMLGGLSLHAALAIFVGLIAVRALLQMISALLLTRLVLGATEKIRVDAQKTLFGAEWRWLSKQDSAVIGNLIVRESERIAGHLGTVFQTAAATSTAVILCLMASALAPIFTAAVMTAGLLVALPIGFMRSRTQAEGTVYFRASEALYRLVDNGVAHLRTARIGHAEAWLSSSFDQAAAKVTSSEQRFETRIAQARAVMQILAAAALAALVYGAIAWDLVSLTVLLPVLVIFARLVPIALTIQQARRSWDFTRPALIDMQRITREAAAHVEPRAADLSTIRLRYAIVARGVTLQNEDQDAPLLDGIDFELPAGTVSSLSGPSGSGKSTLADILAGLILPDAGWVTVDGVRLDGTSRTAWRKRVSYVEQHPFFWPGSVRENLTWGRDCLDDEQLEQALRNATAEFILDLPGGLDFRLADMGRPLSGGERQRLSTARALLDQPDLLIIDEALASLDPELRARLLTNIRGLGLTTLIVSHDEPLGIDIDQRLCLGPI